MGDHGTYVARIEFTAALHPVVGAAADRGSDDGELEPVEFEERVLITFGAMGVVEDLDDGRRRILSVVNVDSILRVEIPPRSP